jgi:hypothetical protein
LAIGAPYEDNGVVYIHLGTSTGVKQTPSQIIKASDLPNEIQNIKTFGYSLSGLIQIIFYVISIIESLENESSL